MEVDLCADRVGSVEGAEEHAVGYLRGGWGGGVAGWDGDVGDAGGGEEGKAPGEGEVGVVIGVGRSHGAVIVLLMESWCQDCVGMLKGGGN